VRAPEITDDFWLDPAGCVHVLDDYFQEHNAWAAKHVFGSMDDNDDLEKGRGEAADQLYRSGWQRGVLLNAAHEILLNGYKPPNQSCTRF
jgi:hypothetical protein